MRNFLIFLLFLITGFGFAQELNCNVVVNAQLTGNENLQIFKTLETQLTEFVNKTQWTNRKFKTQERIDCNIVINVTEQNGENFNAAIQVQSSRPVYGSTYTTPIYNINDKDFTFRYLEFQTLIYNENQYESNLISVLAFHINMVLGLDAESFAKEGGDPYFKQAQRIVNFSQQENNRGWKLEDGLQSRFALIDNILSPTFSEFRTVMYNYHRRGLDTMSENSRDAKNEIALALAFFRKMNANRPNSYLARVFFDAKAEEIEQIFSAGPNVDVTTLIELLNRVAPTHASKWRNIKY
ncbi:type IX secretion system protein PorD [Lacinutrix chionoecetis]